MDETIDYIGERYPDLSETNLRDLHTVGVRFCKPAIRNGTTQVVENAEAKAPASVAGVPVTGEAPVEAAAESAVAVADEVAVGATDEVGVGVTDEVGVGVTDEVGAA